MSGYMPRVGERFKWVGTTFERIEGDLVERALQGDRAEVLFPVRYVEARDPALIGERGLMNVADAADFEF